MAMDRVRPLEMLVRAAETGSFAGAAAALRVTPSAVSQGIAGLERHLGAALFYRTTRQLRLTEEGEALYRQGCEILDRLAQLEGLVPRRAERLVGTLRVGANGPIGRNVIMPRLAAFLRPHPELRLELLVQTEPKEMHTGGMDVLLRVGEPEDTGLVARRLARVRFGAYAAPGYLEAAGGPQEPGDLLGHRCLVHKPPHEPRAWDEWAFERAGERRVVRVPGTVVTDDRESLVAGCLAGVGVMRIGMFDPVLLASGALARVLPGWTCPDGPLLYALYRRTAAVPPKIAAFLDFLAAALADFDREGVALAPIRRPAAGVGLS
jgi:DNA-binding transcriptional LysR family regulator